MSTSETQCLVAVLLVATMGCMATGQICPDEVGDAINSILANCSYCERAHLGLRVDQLNANGTWSTLYSKNSYSFFLPASNNKIFTTASAFFEFGPNYTISTPVYVSVDGDICLVGRGDPSISSEDLMELAGTLKTGGITQVRNIFVDNTFYQGPGLPQNWEWADLTQQYGAIPSPLVLDENTLSFSVYSSQVGELTSFNFSYDVDASVYEVINTVTTSDSDVPADININIQPNDPYTIQISGTVPYGSGANVNTIPALNSDYRFASLLAYALSSNQVTVNGKFGVYACEADTNSVWKQVASLTSPPLSEMMNYTLQMSDNMYAETFLLLLGKTQQENITATTHAQGIQKVKQIVTESFGAQNDSFMQDDGSGVSRQNMASPDALMTVLETMFSEEYGNLYLTFLPTAGRSGTLINRYIGTPAEGILHAKTGTLNGVNCLTGFIDHKDPNYPIITFSILMNMGLSSLIPPVDDIGVLLATVKNC